MPVQFVVGRAGTGKTYRTLDLVAGHCRSQPLGRPIWLIVPRQATFEYERALVARLGAFARVRVVGMESLGQAVLDEVGGMAMPQVSSAGRQMVIGRLLWRHHDQLRYFGSSARRPGLAASVDAMFDDFERSGQPLTDLGDVIDQFGKSGASPSLHAKLADLRLLYGHYQQYLGQDRLDPEKRRQEITRRLRRAESLNSALVFVDAFYEFTENERLTLAEVAAVAERMEINLTLPPDSAVLGDPKRLPDDLSPFHRTEVAYQRLYRTMQKAGVKIESPLPLHEPRRFQADALKHIEARLWSSDTTASSVAPDPASVDFIEAPDTRTEVQRVAACIGDLLRTDGFRRRDILVLVRGMSDYLHLIHAAFAEHGIPYFADRRRPASHHPLIRFVRAAVWIARDRWSPEAVIALGKTELSGLTQPEADRLENRVREFGITASAWLNETSLGYSRESLPGDEEFEPAAPPPDETDDTLAKAEAAGDVTAVQTTLPPTGRDLNAVRSHLQERLNPLIALLGRTAGPATLRTMAIGVGQVIEAFGVRQTVASWIDAEAERNPEQAGEHEQVWSQLQQLLQEMVEVLGDEEMHPAEFIEVLETGLDGFDLAIPPATLDQVLVGTVDRTRSIDAKAVFVLGLSRGMFPRSHRDGSLLSAPERRELHRRNIAIDADIERKQLDERFLAYVAFTRASHRLIVSRPQASERGAKLDSSEFWDRLRALVPDAPMEQCHQSPMEQLSTPRALVGTMLDWARQLHDANADASSPIANDWRRPLYDWLASRPYTPVAIPFGCHPRMSVTSELESCVAVDRLVNLAWPSLTYSNHPKLSEAVTQQLFAPPLTVSAAQLESFASCPFQHFAGYGLKLSRRPTADISNLELSRIYHDVLQRVIDAVLNTKRNLVELTPDEIAWLVRNWVQPIARQLHGGRFLAEARGHYIVTRVERMLGMIFATMTEQLRRGEFTPIRAAVPFGRDDSKLKSPPIMMPDGSTARLRGQIDRIDKTPTQALAVYDYRMTEQRLSMASVFHGLTLRLLASMMVIDRAGLTMRGRPMLPVAGLTSRLWRNLQDVDHPSEAQDPTTPEFLLASKPRGIIQDTHAKAFDKETEAGNSPVVAMYYKKDGSFGLRETTDIAEEEDFRLLLDFVEGKVAELTGKIAAGEIDVAPYWFEDESPCPRCDFRAVCRFERPVNSYRKLESMKREESLEAMRKKRG
ncbi:PD-(D/E)XK nuclease family protein [Humisphaera borealis]|uniref:PD-(D/E)XK nuclease family protein n=1 Tax=Humisphaera borealis TaxID=2807512 RepID=A0A7M2WRR1_9BACT|nr:PD-(D/E)XK nuclease family protein [Humisphaera borealis]QOV88079.1 PD-(D/E)XK nuclease family protein [Humisphaera borealis]